MSIGLISLVDHGKHEKRNKLYDKGLSHISKKYSGMVLSIK